MVTADIEKSQESIAEKLEEKGIDLTSGPPPIEEVLRDVAGQLFLKLVQEYKFEYGDELNADRGAGILSKADREYLWGQREYDYDQSKYKRRDKIRERVKNAILDFTDLEFNLSSDDRDRIFDEFPGDLSDHLVVAIRFFYRGLNADTAAFEEVIEQAVHQAESVESDLGSKEIINVDASINVDRTPTSDLLKQRLESGEPLTDREIGALVRSGEISSEQLDELSQSDKATTLERVLKNRYKHKVQSEEE